MSTAEELKNKGTERYKAGDFKTAVDLFAKAAETDPTVPVYLSNLSAAQVCNLLSMISSLSESLLYSMKMGNMQLHTKRVRNSSRCNHRLKPVYMRKWPPDE
jgi:hypothetical protein